MARVSAPPGLAPVLGYLGMFSIELGDPVEVGPTSEGVRRIIPITGGSVEGPALRGRILPGGADFQIVRSTTLTELNARYCIETGDGENIYVENWGLRSGAPADLDRLMRGEPVDPSLIYFRTEPRLTPTGPTWEWLGSRVFVAIGERHPGRVTLRVYVVT
jgi:hypothetical protein